MTLTCDQIRRIDKLAVEEYGIPGLILMENAGKNATAIIVERVRRRFSGHDVGVVIFCGGGNNGGDGFVIARHLHNAGYPVEIILAAAPARLSPDAEVNYWIANKMSLPIRPYSYEYAQEAVQKNQVLVDALVGTGFKGSLRPPLPEIIAIINARRDACRIAIDIPSGLDGDTGRPAAACVCAEVTITFVAVKAGFLVPGADRFTGEVVVADIGAPPELLGRV